MNTTYSHTRLALYGGGGSTCHQGNHNDTGQERDSCLSSPWWSRRAEPPSCQLCPQRAWLFQSPLQNELQCKQEAELTADMLQMAANPAEGMAGTYCPPKHQGASLICSTLVTTQLFGCYSAGRWDVQIFPQEAPQKHPRWKDSGAPEAETMELFRGLPAREFWIFPNTTLPSVCPHHSLCTGLRSSYSKPYFLL